MCLICWGLYDHEKGVLIWRTVALYNRNNRIGFGNGYITD